MVHSRIRTVVAIWQEISSLLVKSLTPCWWHSVMAQQIHVCVWCVRWMKYDPGWRGVRLHIQDLTWWVPRPCPTDQSHLWYSTCTIHHLTNQLFSRFSFLFYFCVKPRDDESRMVAFILIVHGCGHPVSEMITYLAVIGWLRLNRSPYHTGVIVPIPTRQIHAWLCPSILTNRYMCITYMCITPDCLYAYTLLALRICQEMSWLAALTADPKFFGERVRYVYVTGTKSAWRDAVWNKSSRKNNNGKTPLFSPCTDFIYWDSSCKKKTTHK